MRERLVLGTLTLAAVLAVGSCSDEVGVAVTERFTANLTGAAERPTPVTTPATGTAEFIHVADIKTIFFRLDVAGIDSVSAAHIHAPADTGQAIGVVVGLFAGPATGQGFSGTLAQGVLGAPTGMTQDALLELLRNGRAYVNVHTRGPVSPSGTGGHPAGEIRGQIFRQ